MKYNEEAIPQCAAVLACDEVDLTLALRVGAAWVNATQANVAQNEAAQALRDAMGAHSPGTGPEQPQPGPQAVP